LVRPRYPRIFTIIQSRARVYNRRERRNRESSSEIPFRIIPGRTALTARYAPRKVPKLCSPRYMTTKDLVTCTKRVFFYQSSFGVGKRTRVCIYTIYITRIYIYTIRYGVVLLRKLRKIYCEYFFRTRYTRVYVFSKRTVKGATSVATIRASRLITSFYQ